MSRELQIEVDRDKCVGCTICAQTAPGVFAMDEEGQSVVIDPNGAGEPTVLEAAMQCPMCAITVRDAIASEPLFPPKDMP